MTAIAYFTGAGALLSALATLFVLVRAMVDTVSATWGYQLFRRFDALGREISFATIYLPLSSTITALGISIGVNLVTDGKALFGLLFCALGGWAVVSLGRGVANDMAGRTGMASTRHRFWNAANLKWTTSLPTVPQLQAIDNDLRRVCLVAKRVRARGSTYNVMRWMSLRGPRKLTIAFLLLQAPSLVFASLVAWGAARGNLPGHELQLATIIVGVELLLPCIYFGSLTLSWRAYRSLCFSVADEFERNAHRGLDRVGAALNRALAAERAPSDIHGFEQVAGVAVFGIGKWSLVKRRN